ncbi:hypothetical protein BKA66DRAFT_572583 [Pyrenochaeta sp. MPI-SDFR-AT-0127]|nr:hypothetical protein BKA66DRAFT_572583 [Pyrenochaeta sp. MPI-SDFR-AT-0127]
MSRSCITHFTQLITHTLTNLTISPPPSQAPTPNHTGLIFQAPQQRLTSSTPFPSAPGTATSAFDLSLINGATHPEHVRQRITALGQQRPCAQLEKERDGTSWDERVSGVDGWNVGWEKATMMFVKRKGRGEFRFEKAVMQGWGELDGDEGNRKVSDIAEEGRLEDGFLYQGWVEEAEGVAESLVEVF